MDGKKSLTHKTGQKKIRIWVGAEKLREGRGRHHGTSEPWLHSLQEAARRPSGESNEGRGSGGKKD